MRDNPTGLAIPSGTSVLSETTLIPSDLAYDLIRRASHLITQQKSRQSCRPQTM